MGEVQKTVLVVFGTRPEAVKMCPLVLALKAEQRLRCVLCVTAQHREMLDQVLEAFSVEPDYDLSLMKQGQSLSDITTGVLLGVGRVMDDVAPDVVLVHGDTTTSFAAALAAFYRHVPIGHVEAGLRTRNLESPFPEEYNRHVIDLVSRYCFAPTETSRQNLLDEQKPENSIFVTGNTGIDALRTTVSNSYSHPLLDWGAGSRLLLVTAHRRENLGEPMRGMFRAIRKVVEKHPDVKALYPVHLNPAVRELAYAELAGCERIKLVEPLDVLDFHNVMARCHIVLTDSGGIQEEAPYFGKPVLVMRDTTERPEGVQAGTLKLVGTSERSVITETERLLDDEVEYGRMACSANPYGDGHSSERITRILMEALFQGEERWP